MLKRVGLFALFCLLLNWSTVVVANAISCENLIQPSSDISSHYYENQDYKIVGQLKSPNGQGFLVSIERQPDLLVWGSNRNQFDQNTPIGDIRRIFSILPEEITSVLGFEAFDKDGNIARTRIAQINRVQIPDVDALNAGFETIEKALLQKGSFGFPFRMMPDAGIANSHSFVTEFAESNRLPFSLDPRISYHDLNFHVFPFFVIDRQMHRQAVVKSRIVLRYAEWLKEKRKDQISNQDIEALLDRRSHEIDLLANVRIYFMNRALDDEFPLNPESFNAINNFVGREGNAAEYLTETVAALSQSGHPALLLNVREFLKSVSTELDFFIVDESLKRDLEKRYKIAYRMLDRLEEIRSALISPKN